MSLKKCAVMIYIVGDMTCRLSFVVNTKVKVVLTTILDAANCNNIKSGTPGMGQTLNDSQTMELVNRLTQRISGTCLIL